jgi:predicted acylesterase/phospholipase RssA
VNAAAEVGVVLSGGGANGAYEVGVLRALVHGHSPATGYLPLDPAVYAGTSVGAYNAAVMVSRPGTPATDTADELQALWLDRIANSLERCGNGVFRVRGAPFQFLSPGCLARPVRSLLDFGADAAHLAAFGLVKGAQFVSSEAPLQSRLLSLIDLEAFVSESPFKQLVAESIDLDRLRRSDKELIVAATNWELGVLKLYSKGEIADVTGTDSILASAALPGIFPPVAIAGVPYVDGGVLLNTPLGPVVAAGATTIHLVFIDPHVRNIALAALPSSVDTFYRLFAIIWAANVRQDLLTAAAINGMLQAIQGEGAAAPAEPRPHAGGSPLRQQALGRIAAGRPYRELTIHVYRPATALGSGEGVLDFNRTRLAELIEMGYQDALGHDCVAAGCLRPGASRAPGEAGAGRRGEAR